jgi:hypothetical protein
MSNLNVKTKIANEKAIFVLQEQKTDNKLLFAITTSKKQIF